MSTVEQVQAVRVDQVRKARESRESAEAALRQHIRLAAAAGVSERKLAEASGISRMTVRRILGRE